MIEYRAGRDVDLDDLIELWCASTLGERRPIDNRARRQEVLQHANLEITAWDGSLLVEVARSLSDFSFCTYLSDLAVRPSHPKLGMVVN